jgi:hypothetical protein
MLERKQLLATTDIWLHALSKRKVGTNQGLGYDPNIRFFL